MSVKYKNKNASEFGYYLGGCEFHSVRFSEGLRGSDGYYHVTVDDTLATCIDSDSSLVGIVSKELPTDNASGGARNSTNSK